MTENRMLNKKVNLQVVRQKLLDSISVLSAVCMIIYFSFTSQYFLSVRNSVDIFSSVFVVGIITTGIILIIITRGVDLSVGSIIALTGCVAAILIVNFRVSWSLAILATLIIGFLVGGFNGLLITKFNVVPFIATLDSMNIIRGITFIITDGQAIHVPDPVVSSMGTGRLFSLIPVPAIIMLYLYILFWLITKFTIPGRNVFVVGENNVASRLAGIRAKHLIMVLYVLIDILSVVTGLVVTGLTSTTIPFAGDGYNLDVITAVYLGNNSASGDKGGVWRTFMGILIIRILNNGMALLNVQFH